MLRLTAGFLIATGIALLEEHVLLVEHVGSLAAHDDLVERIAEFERAFRSTPKEPRTPQQQKEAVEQLAGLDAPSVAAALTRGWEQCADDLARLVAERQRSGARIVALIEGQEFGERTLPSERMDEFNALKTRSRTLAQEEEGLREVEAALGRGLQDMRDEASLEWLADNVLGAKKLPLSLRLLAAQSAGPLGPKLAPRFTKALADEQQPEEVVVLLAAVNACGRAAQACAPAVIRLLAHADANVREQAAAALARIASPVGIEALVLRLAHETGHTRRRMAIALEVLTARNLGESAGAWKAWFTKEGAPYVAGEVELGVGRSNLAATLSVAEALRVDPRYAQSFFGIPQDGHSVVYVIDCSGSMVLSLSAPAYVDGKELDAGRESRIAATKATLIEVLGKLEKRDRFNLICFNDVVRAYSPKMLDAATDEVRRAQTWVAGLGASNATNLHDALQEAFRLAGRGAFDRYYESAIDTIFLLTDGTPTTNDGQPDSSERILAAARAWNPQRHVVIHTIGIGKGWNTGFLQQLADEHGGRFVQR